MKGYEALSPLVASLLARCEAQPTRNGIDVLVDLAVFIAAADGKIDPAEQETLASAIQDFSGGKLRAVQISREIHASAIAKARTPAAEHAKSLGEGVRVLGAEEDALRFGCAVALASHGVSPQEWSSLILVAQGAGVSEERTRELLEETRALLADSR